MTSVSCFLSHKATNFPGSHEQGSVAPNPSCANFPHCCSTLLFVLVVINVKIVDSFSKICLFCPVTLTRMIQTVVKRCVAVNVTPMLTWT